MVVVIDYGMGNLKSVLNALNKIDCEAKISSNVQDIRKADALILPGVGAFKDGMDNICRLNLDTIIKEEVSKGKPLLGICLGMQLLFDKSYEGGMTEGLGLISGEVREMEDTSVKIPHIGWNDLIYNKEDDLLKEIKEKPYVYYVHSYYAKGYKEEDLVAYSNYGNMKIPGIVRRKNVMGAQFHPEKSGEVGLRILKNYKEMIL